MILCLNPCVSQCEQTLSTLRFGLSAKKIQNKIQKNFILSSNDEALKKLIREYEQKLLVFFDRNILYQLNLNIILK